MEVWNGFKTSRENFNVVIEMSSFKIRMKTSGCDSEILNFALGVEVYG